MKWIFTFFLLAYVTSKSLKKEKFRTNLSFLKKKDPIIGELIESEDIRQKNTLNLIASENIVSRSVLEAVGSVLTNKYSEGAPGKRYYAGNVCIDEIEKLCQERALKLFKLNSTLWSVNVQAYSGSIANFAVYCALLKPHDKIMGLDLPSGGHLTHGYQTSKKKVSMSSVFFESKPYRLHPSTLLIDYEDLARTSLQYRPKLIIAGASAYSRDWDYKRMREIADACGAYLMADISHISGLVASQACNDPFEHCHVVTTTTHKTLRGPRGALVFCRHGEMSSKVDQAVFPGLQGGPHNNNIAGIAVALGEADTESFRNYILDVKANARSLSEHMIAKGFDIVTNGTDNHLFLWDIRSLKIPSELLQHVLERVGVVTNRNALFGDESALSPSGIRIGVSAITTQGLKPRDMSWICSALCEVVNISHSINREYETLKRIYKANKNIVDPVDKMVNANEKQQPGSTPVKILANSDLIKLVLKEPSFQQALNSLSRKVGRFCNLKVR